MSATFGLNSLFIWKNFITCLWFNIFNTNEANTQKNSQLTSHAYSASLPILQKVPNAYKECNQKKRQT